MSFNLTCLRNTKHILRFTQYAKVKIGTKLIRAICDSINALLVKEKIILISHMQQGDNHIEIDILKIQHSVT